MLCQCKLHATRSFLIGSSRCRLQHNSTLEQTQSGLENTGMDETKLHEYTSDQQESNHLIFRLESEPSL